MLTSLSRKNKRQSVASSVEPVPVFSRLHQQKTRDVDYWTSKKEVYESVGCTFKPMVDKKSAKLVERKYGTRPPSKVDVIVSLHSKEGE